MSFRRNLMLANSLSNNDIVGGGGDLVYPPNNEIWYTTTDNKIYNFNIEQPIIYNNYNDKGILGVDDILGLGRIKVYFLSDDDRKRLISIKLPLITYDIDHEAFAGCTSLSYISMPGVVDIAQAAFYNCGFNEIIIPSTIETISFYAFGECVNLQTIKFEGKVITIGEGAFYGCPLSKIIVPIDLIDYYKELLPEYSNLIIGQ